ncbi:MAG: DUF938 domain-containing protein [Methyloligellaceae bacterium]
MTKAPKFTLRFEKNDDMPDGDDRLFSESFVTNHAPIEKVVTRLLDKLTGNIIEVASGTGQHAVNLAQQLPQLTWWPSDIQDHHIESIAAWQQQSGLSNLKPPICLDVTQENWGLEAQDHAPSDNIVAVVCSNLLHIAPWKVSQGLIAGAGKYLQPNGFLMIYGAFSVDGSHVSQSNVAFDRSLKNQNPEFGVRDTVEIQNEAEKFGLILSELTPMPSNNFMLTLQKQF